MTTPMTPKTRSTRTTKKPTISREECPIAAEISVLKKRMLDRDSPGARSAIRRMEVLDAPLADLSARTAKFDLTDYRKKFSADRATRRFIYRKSDELITSLVGITMKVAKLRQELGLTDENTKLPAEPGWLQHLHETLCRFRRDEAQAKRKASAARRPFGTRAGLSEATPPAQSKRKRSAGSDR